MAYIKGNPILFSAQIKITSGGIIPSGTLEITENGTHPVSEYEKVVVNVPIGENFMPSGTLEINENGLKDVTNFASVDVAVPQAHLQYDKFIFISKNDKYIITPDKGYDGIEYAEITVNVPTGDGETVPEWDHNDFTISRNLTNTTLINTTWHFDEGWQTPATPLNFSVDGTVSIGTTSISFYAISLGMKSNANNIMEVGENCITVITNDANHSMTNTTYFDLAFTGGADVSNPDLVCWVETYGKLQS